MTDQNLISLLETNPEEGVKTVLCLYGKAIKTICSNILRGASEEDIEEAMADAVAAIWQSGRQFQSGRGCSFKSYCYGITRKKALNKRKQLLMNMEIVPLEENMLSDSDNLLDEYEKKEQKEILHTVIKELGEPWRIVFILRYFFFYSVKEIAEEISVPEKKVENTLHRGKKLLKAELMKRGFVQ